MATSRKIIGVLGLALGIYGVAFRPRMLRWGATDDEAEGPFPGADLIPGGTGGGTTPCWPADRRSPMLRKALLGCGLVAPVWWVALDIIGSRRDPGYSSVDQTISELSAQGAPSRTRHHAFPNSQWRATTGRQFADPDHRAAIAVYSRSEAI